MSMNLYCVNLDLWQTPTYITNMCCMTEEGIMHTLTGADAIRALNCYMEWVSSHINGLWKDEESCRIMRDGVNTECKKVQEHIKNTPPEKISVYRM